jgi:hypothetical protein
MLAHGFAACALIGVSLVCAVTPQKSSDTFQMAYRLTPDLLKKLVSCEPEVMRVAGEFSGPAQDEPVLDVEEAAARLEKTPHIQGVLVKHGWNALEFLRTLEATITTMLLMEMLDSGELNELPSGVVYDNVALLRDPPAELLESLAEWKRLNFDEVRQARRFP